MGSTMEEMTMGDMGAIGGASGFVAVVFVVIVGKSGQASRPWYGWKGLSGRLKRADDLLVLDQRGSFTASHKIPLSVRAPRAS